MKKLFLFVAFALCSALSFGASITCADIDFGTVSIKGETLPKIGSQTISVSFSGFDKNDQGITASITEGLLDSETNPSGFYVSGNTYAYKGYDVPSGTCEFTIAYYVVGAGTFKGKLQLTSDYGVTASANIKVVVTDEAIVAKTIPFERVEKTADLKDGDTIVFVCESASEACGPLDGAALSTIAVTLDNGKTEVPEEGIQMFKAKKYGNGWQFITADEDKKELHLDITGKGAFTYADAVGGQILATWGVDISNGVAEVTRANLEADYLYPVRWTSGGSGDRFKPYKNPSGNEKYISIYKKVGASVEIKSKFEVDAVDLGTVEIGEEKEVTVNYTAENLTADIEWDITGTDKALFSVTPTTSTNRTSGSVTVKYLGTATSVKTVSAKLYAVTQDAALDLMDKEIPISITLKANTIKLTKLEFVNAPTKIEQGQSIDMSEFIVYTPNNAEDKSLEWTTDHSYQGTVDANGVLTARLVSGNVIVTATSKRVPSVSASATLEIVKPVITDFTLSDTEVTLYIGGQKQLSVTAWVPDYASESATYSSDKTDIATVSKNGGMITAQAIGDAEITAKIGDVEKKCTVHVVATPVTSISLPSEANLTLGSTLKLNPTILPEQAAKDHELTYVSNNTNVATVDENGLVKGIAEGDAVITATIDGKDAQITIHVKAAKTFAKVTDASNLAANDTIILALASVPVVAGPRDNKKLTVLTSEVTVTNNEAYADNAYRMVITTIKNKTGYALQPVGSSQVLAEQNNDLYLENTTSTKNLMWEFVADGANGIFIRNLGNTNAMFKYHAGNAAIKPYKGNTTDAVYVYVYVRKFIAPPATGISLNKTTLNMQVGNQDVKLKATITPTTAKQEVTWSSSDESVATVDESGWVHAVAEGTATITAKVKENEELSATCEVTVQPQQGTGLDAINEGIGATKIVREGQIMILRGERVYMITGQEIR